MNRPPEIENIADYRSDAEPGSEYVFGEKMPGIEFLSELSGSLEISDDDWRSEEIFSLLEERVGRLLGEDQMPVRLAFTTHDKSKCDINKVPIEVGVLGQLERIRDALNNQQRANQLGKQSIFSFRRRALANIESFNVAFVLPTGAGCELGGHAGDAGPVARLLGGVCDQLITHPNAVNASDLNEMPDNALYVEGSVLARLLMGTVGLSKVLSNRVLTAIHNRKKDEVTENASREARIYANCAVNMVNGGRASAGYRSEEIHLFHGMKMEAVVADSGRAVGRILDFDRLCQSIEGYIDSGRADAVAITSKIDLPGDAHDEYFHNPDSCANPYGGVEAMLTHALTTIFGVPTAHSPQFEDIETMNEDPAYMDPRTGVEGCAVTFLYCLMKGLHRSPKLISDPNLMGQSGVISAEDISCFVTPDGCMGLPLLAALKQGIIVIAVRDGTCRMKNPIEDLPWQPDQFYQVDSYIEAAGLIVALKQGISVASLKRPFASALVNGSLPELDLDL